MHDKKRDLLWQTSIITEVYVFVVIAFQYIDIYVSTISRLLAMSVITSETLNYLLYIKTHKLIVPIVIER